MRVTVQDVQAYKDRGEHFAMVTAYDYTSGQLVDRARLPLILVGDSLGTVIQGHDTTLPVTLDDIIYHARLVARGTRQAMVVGDLPFLTYPDADTGLRNAGRLMQDSGVQAVKLEGGNEAIAEVIERIVGHGIPVMGHLGYTPQSVHAFGKKIIQGKTADAAQRILAEAHRLQEVGVFALVLECVPTQLAGLITAELRIPTIGIGSGPATDGQVQVWHDMLGLYTDFVPRHTKHFANLADIIAGALGSYADEVRAGQFPTAQNASSMADEALHGVLQIDARRSA